MKNIFVFDLDGTLLNKNQVISEVNAIALKEAKQKGHILIVATGRNYIYAQLCIGKYWDLFDYYIGCNGAIIKNIKDNKDISINKTIDFEFVKILVNILKKESGAIQISTIWNVFTDIYLDEKNDLIKKIKKETFFDPFPSMTKMKDDDKKSIVQISAHFEENKTRKMWEELVKKYDNNYTFSITSPRNIDINAKEISKLNAIKKIVEINKYLEDNVFIFGDSQNDIDGLKYFKNSYAMENGFEEAKKVAKNIIGDNNSDAISKVIKNNI